MCRVPEAIALADVLGTETTWALEVVEVGTMHLHGTTVFGGGGIARVDDGYYGMNVKVRRCSHQCCSHHHHHCTVLCAPKK